MKSVILGIDVGGTNIKMGLVTESGLVLARASFATQTFGRRPKDLISGLLSGCQILLQRQPISSFKITAVGVGLPGIVDPIRGMVQTLTNISGWKHVPLAKILRQKFKLPVFVDNDVNLMTLGEWRWGAGQGVANMVCLTLGTGVGGGLMIDGALYRGLGFSAGEIGHIPLSEAGPRCNCGGRGCLEKYIGNQALLMRARQIFRRKGLTLEAVTKMAEEKNALALKFWETAGKFLGLALTGVVNVLNPERIVVGGGIAQAHPCLLKTAEKTIRARALQIPGQMVRLGKAHLGNDAAVLGAQVLVTQLRGKA